MRYAVLVVGLVALMILVSACDTALNNNAESKNKNQIVQDNTMQEDKSGEGAMVEEDGMMENEDEMIEDTSYSGNVLAGTTTPYIDFNQADYEKALADGKVVFLYFYANWCPTCKAEQVDTEAAFDELNLDDVVGFRVNYKDSDTDDFEEGLARKFGISYQHTKIILKDGERVLKAPDTWNKQRYIDEITGVV